MLEHAKLHRAMSLQLWCATFGSGNDRTTVSDTYIYAYVGISSQTSSQTDLKTYFFFFSFVNVVVAFLKEWKCLSVCMSDIYSIQWIKLAYCGHLLNLSTFLVVSEISNNCVIRLERWSCTSPGRVPQVHYMDRSTGPPTYYTYRRHGNQCHEAPGAQFFCWC